MLIVDEDLDLLEDYLDGALDASDAAAVRARLVREPDLACALEQLRANRELRQRMWAALEPDDREASQLAARLGAISRRVQWIGPLVRRAVAVAAVVTIAFFAGWQVRGKQKTSASIASQTAPNHAAALTYHVALTDETGRVTAVQEFDSLDKAREFTHDLVQWQDRQRQMRDGAAVVVADRF